MKVSQMITSLEYMMNTYGDLDVIVSLDNEDGDVIRDDSIVISYIGTGKTHGEIGIQNFQY